MAINSLTYLIFSCTGASYFPISALVQPFQYGYCTIYMQKRKARFWEKQNFPVCGKGVKTGRFDNFFIKQPFPAYRPMV
ncbi:hypothetical protein D5272_05550 [bacterium D16-76]|nr:hypothetical protein [bacterium D16-76]